MCTSCAYDISKDSSGSLNESRYPGSYPVPEKRIDNPAASLRKVCISLPVFCLCVFSLSRPVERFVACTYSAGWTRPGCGSCEAAACCGKVGWC